MQIGSLGINILGGGRRVIDETAPTISALSAGTQDAEGDVPVTLSVDEGGTFFWVLVTAGATAPSAAEIEAGQASGGGSPADSGALTVSANGGPYDIALAGGLDGSYDLYAVVRDSAGNVSDVASDTGLAIDSTAPALSGLTVTSASGTTAAWSVTSDEASGTIYAGVRASADAALTAAQLIAGSGGAGLEWSTDASPTADSDNGGSFTGLSLGVDYAVDVVQVDAAGNVSGVVSSATFQTEASGVELLYVSTGQYPSDGTDAGSSASDRTIGGLSLGDPDANRRIVVALNAVSQPVGASVSGVTVAGVTATLIAEAVEADGNANAISQIWEADVPTGTTGDVVVSWESEGYDVQVDLYRLIHPTGLAYDTATNSSPTATSLSLDVNTMAGGFVVATASNLNGNAVSITGATSDNSGDYRSNEHFNAASAETVTSETPRAITVTQSSAAAFAGVAASWAP